MFEGNKTGWGIKSDWRERERAVCTCLTDILLSSYFYCQIPKEVQLLETLLSPEPQNQCLCFWVFFPSFYQVGLCETVFLNCYIFFLHFAACWAQIPQFTLRTPCHLRFSYTSETIPFPSSTSISEASTMCQPPYMHQHQIYGSLGPVSWTFYIFYTYSLIPDARTVFLLCPPLQTFLSFRDQLKSWFGNELFTIYTISN